MAEEEDEAEAVQGDEHQAVQLLLTSQLFVQEFFFLFFYSEKTFFEFQCGFSFIFPSFVH